MIQRRLGVLLPEWGTLASRGNVQNVASTETGRNEGFAFLPAGACAGAEVHNKEIKRSRDSPLKSGEPIYSAPRVLPGWLSRATPSSVRASQNLPSRSWLPGAPI